MGDMPCFDKQIQGEFGTQWDTFTFGPAKPVCLRPEGIELGNPSVFFFGKDGGGGGEEFWWKGWSLVISCQVAERAQLFFFFV